MQKYELPNEINSRDATDPAVFLDRRVFLKQATATVGMLAGPMACAQQDSTIAAGQAASKLTPPINRPDVFPAKRTAETYIPSELDDALTPRLAAASNNNFYEFLYGRAGDVWPLTHDFLVEPWAVEITGECNKPTTLDLDALFKFEHEERLYHFRCVERWAMNVPWSGFPLRKLLERVEPTSNTKYLRFTTANRPDQMPGLRGGPANPWPYHEGLRLDEAMNELAMVVTGVYGEPLLKQHGAPIRIIVPWKYGYKSPKSIVKIELLREQPPTFWGTLNPHEYGFLSNVNPYIPHPRWSQARSYWLDKRGEWFPTPILNGYGKYVANLYPDEPRKPVEALRRGQIAR